MTTWDPLEELGYAGRRSKIVHLERCSCRIRIGANAQRCWQLLSRESSSIVRVMLRLNKSPTNTELSTTLSTSELPRSDNA